MSPELVAWAAAASPSTLATLAPVVMSVADSGDLRANALLTLSVEELMLHLRTLARQAVRGRARGRARRARGGLMIRGYGAAETTRAPAQVGGAWGGDAR
jgi:N-acetylglucosamine kinase-like BadF-type ATPase